MTTISAVQNPDLANELLEKATSRVPEKPQGVTILAPWSNTVALPGGYITPAGDVLTSVEVRELSGRDEEVLGKITNPGRQFLTILSRGAVSISGEPITESILDAMLVGDRDAVMLGIYKATFGPDIDVQHFCAECGETTTHNVNVDNDIPVRKLEDPLDREFEIVGRKTIRCALPTGAAQKAVLMDPDRTMAEMTTDILMTTVMEIDGASVISKSQVQDLGVVDRRKVSEALLEKSPGPQVGEAKGTCNSCGTTVVVGVNIGAIFRL